MSVDKVLVQFESDLKQLRAEVDSLHKQLGKADDEAQKLDDSIGDVDKQSSKLSATFKNLGGAIAAAFSIREVIQFASEAEKLARTAEGVKVAFDRLNDPLLLTRLREATKGTVNDLVLMQTAVKAANFKLPLDQLSKFLGFAAQRARETGESVDYLVESIVLGISRKSIPIIDNLGLSATQIQEEFKKTGDFAVALGNIIDQEMSKGASATAEQAEAADRAKAEFENLKIQIGQGLLPVFTNMRVAFNEFLKTIDFSLKGVKKYREELRLLGLTELQQQEIMAIQDFANAHQKSYGTALEAATAYLAQTKAGYEELKKSIEENGLSEGRRNSRYIYQERIKTIESYIKTLQATEREEEKLTIKQNLLNASMHQFKEYTEDKPGGVDYLVKQLIKSYEKLNYEITDILPNLSNQEDIMNEIYFSGLQLNPTVQNLIQAYKEGIITLDQFSDAIRGIKEEMDEAKDSTNNYIDDIITGFGAASILFGSYSDLLGQIGDKQSALADFGRQLAFFEIASAQAVAVANAVKTASQSAPNAITYFVFLSSILSSIAVTIGKAKSLIEGQQVPKFQGFAKGVVGLEGEGTETSDSIFARLSKGESVITAKGTRQDKGLFEAANKLKLQEYINDNYVLPALIKAQSNNTQMFDDYRLYLAMLNNKKAVLDGSKEVVKAIERRHKRYDWN